MAFVPSYNSRILYGALSLSTQVRNMAMATTGDMVDVTVLTDTSKVFVAGMTDSTFTADGPLDVDGSGPWASYTADKGIFVPITYAPSGLTTGAEAFLVDGVETELSTLAANAGSVDFRLAAQTSGPADAGNVVEDLTAITTTGNGTARDFTAASSNGAVFHLHVTEYSSLTSDVITIEDSSTGSSGWATIATFASVTGTTSERVEITGTVKRYVRVVDTCTGSGSLTRSVAMARR